MKQLNDILAPLVRIADAFDANNLDNEARKYWGVTGDEKENSTPHDKIELYTSRGGGQLLTLAHCMAARDFVKVIPSLAFKVLPGTPSWQECAATGQSCSHGPYGPDGAEQCQYCGAAPEPERKEVHMEMARLTFTYRNYRGEVSTRTVRPVRVWFGHTQWHRDDQWFLEAFDEEKQAKRDFALRDINAAPLLAGDEIKGYYTAAHNFVQSIRHMLGAGYGEGHHMADMLRVLQARNEAWLRLDKEDVARRFTDPKRKFSIGDRVTKTSGSKWTGRVVGFYSTELTPIGYCVESETETGSVQIYPERALAPAPK